MKGKRYTNETYGKKLKSLSIDFLAIENYINNKTAINHKCLKCNNVQKLRPDHLIKNKTKCKICDNSSGFKLTNEMYDEKISFSNLIRIENYRGNTVKIYHRCKICDEKFKYSPKIVLRGQKCKCERKYRKSDTDYISLIDGSNVEIIEKFKNLKFRIKHRCKKCGNIWKVKPVNFLKNKICKKCDLNLKGEKYKKFLKDNKLNLELEEPYKGVSKKVLHNCLQCDNSWETKPNYILNGSGCPICASSKGEKKVKKILESLNIEYKMEWKVDNYRYDFYLPSKNICIEYDGIQHFKPIDFFGGEKIHSKIKKNDKIKESLCRNKKIILIRIPYTDFDLINKDYIKNLLNI